MSILEELRWKKFPVGSNGFVTLVDVMGDDLSVVQAARTSYGRDSRECGHCEGLGVVLHGDEESSCPVCGGDGEIRSVSPEEANRLIRYLMAHRHSTPFEMAELKFLVRVPMDCWRQWVRHRTASINEYSTRYTEAIDSRAQTPPDGWRLQSASNKQGSDGMLDEWPEGWSTIPNNDADLSVGREETCDVVHRPTCSAGVAFRHHHAGPVGLTPGQFLSKEELSLHLHTQDVYQRRLDLGVAREQARKDLPLSTYTEAYWKCNLHNLLHFLGLRMDAHAQLEIREYATIIGREIVAKLFPITWAAFENFRLNAMSLSGDEVRILSGIIQSSLLSATSPDVDDIKSLVGDSKSEARELLAKMRRLGFELPE